VYDILILLNFFHRLDMELSKLPPISSPTKFPESTFNFQASNLAQTYKSGVTEASGNTNYTISWVSITRQFYVNNLL